MVMAIGRAFILLVLASTLLVGCTDSPRNLPSLAAKTELSSFVIYGDDNRKELYREDNVVISSLAMSSAAIFRREDLDDGDGHLVLNRPSFQEEYKLCPGEKFLEQTLGPICSGVLVAKDLVLTAGHCIPSEKACRDGLVFNFDFFQKTLGYGVEHISKASTYACSKLILKIENTLGDFALVKLDRDVVGIPPIEDFTQSVEISLDDELVMTGFPSGLPLKITDDGRVLSKSSNKFLTDLDSFGGNSGSPVYSKKTGSMIGILSRGELDFEKQGSCNVVKRCEEGDSCNGEAVSYLDRVIKAIAQYKELGYASPGTSVKPQIHSSFDSKKIPDFDFGGLESFIQIDQLPMGRKVYIGIKIEHEWVGDLLVLLFAPDGERYTLRNLESSSTPVLDGVYGFDLVPFESLRPLAEMSQTGLWKLQIIDSKSGDQGSLINWRVIYN